MFYPLRHTLPEVWFTLKKTASVFGVIVTGSTQYMPFIEDTLRVNKLLLKDDEFTEGRNEKKIDISGALVPQI